MSKIMIIDDDSAMREIMVCMTHSYYVCRNGAEALEHNEDMTLIFMDWIMPGICGLNLVRALQEKYPKAKIVVVSGLDLTDENTGGCPVLQKPFRRDALNIYLKEV